MRAAVAASAALAALEAVAAATVAAVAFVAIAAASSLLPRRRFSPQPPGVAAKIQQRTIAVQYSSLFMIIKPHNC
ncbi:Protein of unknown function [Gryllus bimaculatus]|nr:Protein of unknown function [Gryllus bimaculatus]